MASKRDRERRPARRPSTRLPKRRLLVLCEGEVTEPAYVKGFAASVRSAVVEVEIAREHGVPLTLVKEAIALSDTASAEARRTRDRFAAFDEVWCVFDVDEHPNIPDAMQLAAAKGIHMAVSNPCFELWLLLHFRASPGERHRHQVQKMLREFLAGYDKHLDFGKLVELAEAKHHTNLPKLKRAANTEAAVAAPTPSRALPCVARATERALRLDADADAMDEAGRNPTTGVYRLTQSIASEQGPDSGDVG